MDGYWEQNKFQSPNFSGRICKWDINDDGTVTVELLAGWSFEDGMHILRRTFDTEPYAGVAVVNTHKCDCHICRNEISASTIDEMINALQNPYASDFNKFKAFLDHFGIGYELKENEKRIVGEGAEKTNKEILIKTIEMTSGIHDRVGGYSSFCNEIVFDMKTGKFIVYNIWE